VNVVIQSLNIQTFCGIISTKVRGPTKSGLVTKRECVPGVTVGNSVKKFLSHHVYARKRSYERTIASKNEHLLYTKHLNKKGGFVGE
jgi:hypothetical protein